MSSEKEDSHLERMAKELYEEKKGEKRENEEYYKKKMEEFGLDSIDRFVNYHPSPSKLMKSGVTYAHNDLEPVADAIANDEDWAVVSGFNTSDALHLGHKLVLDEVIWLQKQGAEVFIPLTDDETYIVDKAESLSKARKNAYKEIIPSIAAMDFDPEKTNIFTDSDYKDIYSLAMDLSKEVNLNEAMSVFGFDGTEDNPGSVFYRSGVQLAQIQLPQTEEFNGPKPTLIPVGIDQHPYISLSRDVARRKGLQPPSQLYIKFLEGLDGKGKMSSSRPDSTIFLTEDEESAKEKIRKSYTGGSSTAKHQKAKGGIPEVCPVYQLQANHFEEDMGETLYEECENGEVLCGECKENLIEDTLNYLEKHKNKIENIDEEYIEKFLLEEPLESIFED